MLEELSEEEGSDLEQLAYRLMISRVVIRQQYIALLAKGGSVTRLLRTKNGIRMCVNRVRRAGRLSRQSLPSPGTNGSFGLWTAMVLGVCPLGRQGPHSTSPSRHSTRALLHSGSRRNFRPVHQ